MPLSVQRTKAIADDCVAVYLERILDRARSAGPRRRPARDGRHLNIDWNDARQQPAQPAGRLQPMPYRQKGVQSRNRSHSDGTDERQHSERVVGGYESMDRYSDPMIFKELEEYLVSSFKGCDCLNSSFSTVSLPSPPHGGSSRRSPRGEAPPTPRKDCERSVPEPSNVELDPKTLLIGDIGENSSWWMNDGQQQQQQQHGSHSTKLSSSASRVVTSKSPRIDYDEVARWYQEVLTAGASWEKQWTALRPDSTTETASFEAWRSINMNSAERQISEARLHLRRTLLKATENLLKRPRRPLKKPDDSRFLLILLGNPMLHSSRFGIACSRRNNGHHSRDSSYHSGIIKRLLGLMSRMPETCHNHFISWFSRMPTSHFRRTVELVGGFVTYRLARQHGRKHAEADITGTYESLIPSFASASGTTAAEMYMAINGRQPNSKSAANKGDGPDVYGEDWQLLAAAWVMTLLFTANNVNVSRQMDGYPATSYDKALVGWGNDPHGHIVPISTFYNSLLDYADLVADYETWESKSAKFTFCQYPFFLSIWAKIRIMEHDARRQMDRRAREAFFNSILNRKAISQYLVLKVRRDCLVEDSLRGVSEVVGTGQEEIKKGLRIVFLGEEGVDAGGLRKEWFLLLVREIFDPNHGAFSFFFFFFF